MTTVIGHATATDAFAESLASGALHHAWLLAGPEGIGKAGFAHWAAAGAMGATARDRSLIAAGSHPDLIVLRREVWDKGAPPAIVPRDQRGDDDVPARSIRVAQVRSLRARLATVPALAARRVIIVDAVDDFEREGANALLKSLEEPPAGTVFLLVSHAPGRLLPTIRSRCRLLRFGPLSDGDLQTVLSRALPDADAAELAALVAAGEGSPGKALRYAGLEIAELDASLARLIAKGDADNAIRSGLARRLATKAAQPRYEAFLDRAVSAIAAHGRVARGPGLAAALDAHAAARELVGAAIGLSLDPAGTVFEMAGLVAGLAPRAA